MSEFMRSVEGGVMRLVLNRPEAMNALSPAIMEGLMAALEDAARDPAIGCIVVRGAGDKAFCAGGDVKYGGRRPACWLDDRDEDRRPARQDASFRIAA